MREIVLDTETTGLDPDAGHRLIEIACIELLNHVPTGRVFHHAVDPEREVGEEAFAVHGISTEMLRGKPLFAAIADEMLAFIGGDPLVIHNAEFDLKFINAELRRCGKPALEIPFIDTVALARKRFPGSPASLDALCRRFAIDLSQRSRHGARLDAELLASVYLELIGGRQPGLDFAAQALAAAAGAAVERIMRPPRPHAPSAAELAAHAAFLAKLKAPIWLAEE
ncbi:MAG TPA: DNA polymerase III subunit epsilon [Stellaceae bacterium]|nr:DNA polymerase III subunit epsilon [Stellaceae bacterium]